MSTQDRPPNAGLREFERAVRRRVRREVQTSEVLWAEYWRRRRVNRRRAVMLAIWIGLQAPGAVLMFLVLTTLFLGIGAFVGGEPAVRLLNPSQVTLVCQALLMTGFGLLVIQSVMDELRTSYDLAVLAYLPYSDREWSRRMRRTFGGGWSVPIVSGGFIFFAYAFLAWRHAFSPTEWIGSVCGG